MKKIRELLNNTKLITKLNVGYVVIFVIIFGISSSLLYHVVSKSLKSGIEDELNNTNNLMLYMIESELDSGIKHYLRGLAESNKKSFSSLNRQVKDGVITLRKAKKMARDTILSQTVGKSGYAYCLDSSGIIKVHPNKKLIGKSLIKMDFIKKQVESKNGYLVYQWKNPGENISRPKALYMVYFKEWDWIISISSYKDEFRDLISIDDIREKVLGIKIGQSGYSYILDRSGKIIIHPFYKESSFSIVNFLKGNDLIGKLQNNKGGKFEYNWKNPGEKKSHKKIAYYKYFNDYDWYVVSSCYQDEFYGPLTLIKYIFAVIIALSLLLVIPINFIFSSYIVGPLEEIVNNFKRGLVGDYTGRLNIDRKDEIGDLSKYFNEFMNALESLGEKDLQLHHAHKMETIGTMAGGMAHDFNNILTCIMSSVDLVKWKLSNCASGKVDCCDKYILSIEESVSRAVEHVNQLMDISRSKDIKQGLLSVNESLRYIQKVLNTGMTKNIKIEIEFGEDDPFIFGNSGFFEQAILNLAVNAYHAMTIMRKERSRWGGVLRIEVDSFNAGPDECLLNGYFVSGNKYVSIKVSDTGVGIGDDLQRTIFKPFFSTKDSDNGTGLGLAMVKSTMDKFDGFLELESSPGEGAIFSLYFPKMNDNEIIRNSEENLSCDKNYNGSVLVIDSNPTSVETMERLISSMGYEVFSAYSAQKAVDVYGEYFQKIDYVIIDVEIHDMFPQDLYCKLIAINDNIKVSFSSENENFTPSFNVNGLDYAVFKKPLKVEEIFSDFFLKN